MDRKELDKILLNHKRWLQRSDGWSAEDRAHLTAEDLRGMDLHGVELPRANLFAADLRGANLQDAKLYEANLRGADLQGANLRGANLCGAVLWEADLRHADFSGADLTEAVLLRADLRDANLFGADLQDADLQYADCGADLRCADLRGAIMCDADFRDSDFRGADLRDADLRGAILWDTNFRDADLRGADFGTAYTNGMKTDTRTKIDWPMECPETGSFIGWKKAGEYIVKLEIPEDARRSSATTDRCRASAAKVLEIQNLDGTKADVIEAKSMRGGIYIVGEMVYPDKWDKNRWNECSHGIHFFMTREDAVAL